MKKCSLKGLLLIFALLFSFSACDLINQGTNPGNNRIIDFRNKINGESTYKPRTVEATISPGTVSTPTEITGLKGLTEEECADIFVFEPDDKGIKITYNVPEKILADLHVHNKAGYDIFSITYVDSNGNHLTKQSFTTDTYNAVPTDGWQDESKTWIYPLVAPNETVKLYIQIGVWKADEIDQKTTEYIYEAFYDVQSGNGGLGHVDEMEEKWDEESQLNIAKANATEYSLKDVIAPEADKVRKRFTLWTNESSKLNWDTAEWINSEATDIAKGDDAYTYDITKCGFLKTAVVSAPYVFYQFSYEYILDDYPELLFSTPVITSPNIKNTYLSLPAGERNEEPGEKISLKPSLTDANVLSLSGFEDYTDYVFVAKLYYTPSEGRNIFPFQYDTPTGLQNDALELPKGSPEGIYYFKKKVSDFYNPKCKNGRLAYGGGKGTLVLQDAYLTKQEPVTVTVELNGGTLEKTTYKVFVNACNLDIPNPTKDGYSFIGWYTDSSLETKFEGILPENSTLYAKWDTKNKLSYEKRDDIEHDDYSYIFKNLENYTSDTLYFVVKNTSDEEKDFVLSVLDKPITINETRIQAGKTYSFNFIASDFKEEMKDSENHIVFKISSDVPFEVIEAVENLVKKLNISVELNGGFLEKTSYEIPFGNYIDVSIPDPTKDGYLFAGWYTDSSLETKFEGILTENYTLYAKWDTEVKLDYEKNNHIENNVYSYSFTNLENYTSGTLYFVVKNTSDEEKNFVLSGLDSSKEIKMLIPAGETGAFAFKVSDFTEEMKDFQNHISFTLTSNVPFELVEAVVTLVERNINISVELNGGFLEETTYKIPRGTNINNSIPIPTKEGYLFAGWYTDSSLETKFKGILREDTTLYAKWDTEVKLDYQKQDVIEDNHYSYIFKNLENYKSGTFYFVVKNTSDEEKPFGLGVLNKHILINDPRIPAGKTEIFTFKASDFTEEMKDSENHIVFKISSDVPFEIIEAVVTLVEKNINVSVELNGGFLEKTTYKIPLGTNINNSIPNPTKEGYFFAGWYTDSSLETKFEGILTENITLYAKWITEVKLDYEKLYDIEHNHFSYIFKNLENYTSGTFYFVVKNTSDEEKGFRLGVLNKPISITNSIIPAGKTEMFTFKASDFTEEMKDPENHIGLMISTNAPFEIIEAVLTSVERNINISVELNGGILEKTTYKIPFGANINDSIPNPTKEGCFFAGWYTDSSLETKVEGILTENSTLYAKWITGVKLDYEKQDDIEHDYYSYIFKNLENYTSGTLYFVVKNTSVEEKGFGLGVFRKPIPITNSIIPAGKTETFTFKASDFTEEMKDSENHIRFTLSSNVPFELVDAYISIK